MKSKRAVPLLSTCSRLALASLLLLPVACKGDTGPRGPAGSSGGSGGGTNSVLAPDEDPPGVNFQVVSLGGGSGANGTFRAGDHISIRFTVQKDDGSDWDITELASGRALVSGPTFNYQRVIAEQRDLATKSVQNKDGSYTYTFADAIPATYLAPLNDTPTFGTGDGELTGQNLMAGTYTVAIYGYFSYTVEDLSGTFRDVGDYTQDFLYGGATTLDHREVVKKENCDQCHVNVQAHGGSRQNVTLCLMCHTAGAEDGNDPSVAGGTPNVTVDFRVMIHKIHNGEHLPSVNGIATNADGSRNYAATPMPYQIGGHSLADFSDVAFPVWPSLSFPTARDMGYSGLTSTEKAQEDTVRTGVVSCASCHGDPDGTGPLTAPAQGGSAYSQPSRKACGSCHDDIDWTRPYTSNGMTMPMDVQNSACVNCHFDSNTPFPTQQVHVHPLKDPAVNPGLNLSITSVDEAGTNDGDGTLDPGEKVSVTFTMTDDTGADVDPADVASLNVYVGGPTSNPNLVLNGSIPTAILTGMQPYTVNLPETVYLEYLGDSTAALGDIAVTSRAPHLNVSGAQTMVYVATPAAGGSSTLASDATAPQNYIDVADSTGFARDDYLVIDRGVGGSEEYLKIQYVDGNRLWFNSTAGGSYKPGLAKDHSMGASVGEVTLDQKTEGVDYAIDEASGGIVELVEFGNGNAVICTYTTDFVVPTSYPLAINDSPDLGETYGKWTGKSLVDGTYTATMWGYRNVSLVAFGETNSYRASAAAVHQDFLVGSATTLEPYDLISAASNCYACHSELIFHGGTRAGFDACFACHVAAGSEDRPQYVAANAPATTGNLIEFNSMLHKIHRGAELANASTYAVVGFGASPWPNNYGVSTYEDVEFPAFPDGVQDCSKCHGDGNLSWTQPVSLDHPTEQGAPGIPWTIACGSCHDSATAQSHIASQSFGGVETCTFCHGPGKFVDVQTEHKVR